MRPHRPGHSRGIVTRVAIGAAASLAVVASGGTAALAEDTAPVDEIDPSTVVLEAEEPAGDIGTSTGPVEPAGEDGTETPTDESEPVPTETTEGEVTETETDSAPGAEVEVGDETAEPGDEVEAPAQPIVADYGWQKVRIGVQQADGSYLPPGTSFAGTTMTIQVTGGVSTQDVPLPDDTTTCTVVSATLDTVCVPDEDEYLVNETRLALAYGQTATITANPASVPAGLVIAPASASVGTVPWDPECEDNFCERTASEVQFDVTATPEAVTAATTAGQPVAIDVVAPLELAPDNGVTGVTVTAQSPNGTAVVNGDLPPVIEQPADVDDVTAPVAEAAPSGTSRIVFTPNAGFVGATTFGYAVATQNGTVTGVATVTVNPAPVVVPPAGPGAPGNVGSATPTRFTPARADGTLPSTGGPAEELLGLGALLVVAGAGALATRRRSDRERALLG